MATKDFLTLIRVVYVAVIASAFSSYLNKFIPWHAVILSILFVFFLAFESVARTLACNLVLDHRATLSAWKIRFAQYSIILEALAILFASHWVLNYLDVTLLDSDKTSILTLCAFVSFNIINNFWHIYHYHKSRFIPRYVTFWKFPWLSLVGDLYEINHKSSVPFMAGAKEKDIEFTQWLVKRKKVSIPKGGIHFKDIVRMGVDSPAYLIWYVFVRAWRNITVQIYGMNLIILNLISVGFLLWLWANPQSLLVFVQEYISWKVSTLAIVFGSAFVITIAVYFCTTYLEIRRQVIVKEDKRPLSIVFDPKLPAEFWERVTQVIGNCGVIFSFVLASFVVISESSNGDTEAYFGYWIIITNSIIAFGSGNLSRSPERVTELEKRIKDDSAIVESPASSP